MFRRIFPPRVARIVLLAALVVAGACLGAGLGVILGVNAPLAMAVEADAATAGAPAGGGNVTPQQRAAAARVIALLKMQQRAAEGRLESARKVVVSTGLAAQQLRARSVELVLARQHLALLLGALPASSNHVLRIDATHGPFASHQQCS